MIDRAHRLRRRQPDVGAQGAGRGRAPRCSRRQAPRELAGADGIVVPGVGHFGATRALDGAVARGDPGARVGGGTPLLGICLGMQWLFEGSDEAPDVPGLGAARRALLSAARGRRRDGATQGAARRLERAATRRGRRRLLDGRRAGRAGLLHALATPRRSPATPSPSTEHGEPFAAVVERGHVVGVQFHPEKSGDAGLRILRNFLRRVRLDLRAARCRSVPNVQELRTMLSKRIIACLDVRDGQVVKGVNFEGLRSAGDPAELARRYNVEGIDELVILDITATLETRRALARHDPRGRARAVHPARRRRRHPHRGRRGGGGRRRRRQGQPEHARRSPNPGADHARSPTATAARRSSSPSTPSAIAGSDRFAVYARSGTTAAGRDAVEWAREAEARGAGEILLTSIDRDGTEAGFDCELTAAVSRAVSIPVIASGGAGTLRSLRRRLHRRPRRRGAGRVDLPLLRARRRRPEAAPRLGRHPHALSPPGVDATWPVPGIRERRCRRSSASSRA